MDSIGIHGTKKKYVQSTINNGLVRNSNAWFVYSPGENLKKLSRSILLSLYFSISLSTLNKIIGQKQWSWYQWYTLHPEEIPVLLTFHLNSEQQKNSKYYECEFPEYEGLTLPYSKVGDSGKVSSNVYFQQIEVPEFLELCKQFDNQEKRVHLEMNERFFRKYKTDVKAGNFEIPKHVEYYTGDLCSLLEPHFTKGILEAMGCEVVV